MKSVELFNKPTNVKHKNRKDPRLKREVVPTFESLYPKCVAAKYADPSLTKMELARKYCGLLGMSAKSFSNMMDSAGWYKVESKFRSSAGQSETTDILIKGLEEEKLRASVKHVRKMISYIGDAHKTVKHVTEENSNNRSAAAKSLGSHLSDLQKLESLGSKVFGLEKDDKNVSKTVINLAVLAKFDPTA